MSGGRKALRPGAMKGLVVVCAALALLATAAIARPAGRATPANARLPSSAPLNFDGRLAAAGERLCKSLHVSPRSITELSCQALQRTVKSGPYPFVWQLTQVLSATMIAGSDAPRAAREKYGSQVYASFRHYLHPSFSAGLTAAVGGGLRYYDDNAWVGLDLVQAYNESGQRQLRQAAAGILAFQRTGEWRPGDPPDQQQYPGGIYWNANRRFRSLNATAATAQLALELYADTKSRADLALGEQEYNWVHQTLGTPSGLYREQVDPGGAVIGTGEDNGNGFMIFSGVLLYHATHDKQYLDQAVKTAKASLKRFTTPKLTGICSAYDASYFSNLKQLRKIEKLSSINPSLRAYASWVVKHTNPRTGVFTAQYNRCHAPCPQAGASATMTLRAQG